MNAGHASGTPQNQTGNCPFRRNAYVTTLTEPASIDRPYHHGSLREALMATGLDLLAEQDEETVSLREIARRAGVSATSVYRHFPDKNALFAALARQGLDRLAQSQRQVSATAGGGAAGFRAAGEAYVQFALANPALFRLIFTAPQRHACAPAGEMGGAMELLLDNAAALAPPDADARTYALQCWALVHGIAMLMLDGQLPSDPALIRSIIDQPPFTSRNRTGCHK
jgi:AcrR family transcriptional regulator